LLFLFLKQLFSSFSPENIVNCEIIKNILTGIFNNFSCNSRKIKERNYNNKKLQRKYHYCLFVLSINIWKKFIFYCCNYCYYYWIFCKF